MIRRRGGISIISCLSAAVANPPTKQRNGHLYQFIAGPITGGQAEMDRPAGSEVVTPPPDWAWVVPDRINSAATEESAGRDHPAPGHQPFNARLEHAPVAFI